MLKSGVFVSDTGQILDARPGELRWHLDYPRADFDLSAYAIRNLGFVWFKLETNGARLKLRADLFTTACFERVVRLVFEHRIERLVIEHEAEGEPAEVLHNINDIIARLDFLRGTTPGERPRDSYILETLDLGRLRHGKRRRLAETFAAWVRHRGQLPSDLEPLRRIGAFDGGHLLVNLEGKDQAIIRSWPSNIVCYSASESAQLIGRDLSDQPDSTFGHWAAKPYYEVVRSAAARLDLIEAVIRPPNGPSLVSRYERLLLPWRTSAGDFWVSGTSLNRSRRALRSAR
ncbi:hypothetical protein GCM10011611_31700 [Aliidongia dinghuensis]|uniref:Uncharacterized protein n=1 Tax=Aliidongia dinghuensis TaxID=1867774 RepID=A0A8J2YUX8_9PROT|nr:hypothetical protein [Aliidongia dinghuensis]GGF23254.1 hypothetical protein GCM10011611_31700 [Aliidongia dinghuensis]